MKDDKITALSRRLADARQQYNDARNRVQESGERQSSRALYAEILTLERLLAEARGEEYADPLDFPVQWDTGAPLPHVFANSHRTFLTFYLQVPAPPNWDGTSVQMVQLNRGEAESLALVEFKRCLSVKIGAPNDEVFDGHPLWGRGLDDYTAQIVRNSGWLAELEKINSVHRYYRPENWRNLNHYIFWFHDETVECVAESFKVETHQCLMVELLAEVCKRLVG